MNWVPETLRSIPPTQYQASKLPIQQELTKASRARDVFSRRTSFFVYDSALSGFLSEDSGHMNSPERLDNRRWITVPLNWVVSSLDELPMNPSCSKSVSSKQSKLVPNP